MVADSGAEGPVLWLTACCHGDEVGGMVIIQEIFKKIRKNNLLTAGSLYSFPLMNPIGFETGSRRITFSREDLNRLFPGDPRGTLGERIANTIFTAILKTKPALVIDLHNDWIKSIPYALIDTEPESGDLKIHATTTEFALETGFPVIRDTERLQCTLPFTLRANDIPSFTLELGESYIVNEKNIEYGVQSVENIMSMLGMTIPAKNEHPYPLPGILRGKILDYSSKPSSSTTGIVRFLSKPGDIVREGKAFAGIYNVFGKRRETMRSTCDALVLGHNDTSVSFPGMPVMAFGTF